LLQTVSS
jgi:hypothetical protein